MGRLHMGRLHLGRTLGREGRDEFRAQYCKSKCCKSHSEAWFGACDAWLGRRRGTCPSPRRFQGQDRYHHCEFRGRRTVRFLQPADCAAHRLAPPRKPNVVVQNMPGAGGLRGANYLFNVAARDGTVLGVVSQTVAVGQVLATTPGIQYDARRFTWIGRINSNVEVHHTWHTSGIRSIEDAKKREVILAGTGPTSSSVVMPRLMNELIGTRFKVVTGFQGPTSAQLAFERGEVEGIVKPWSSIKTSTPDWLRDKKINLIVQHTQMRHPELQDVPTIVELGRDEAQRQIFALFAGGAALGTALLAPPGVPERT